MGYRAPRTGGPTVGEVIAKAKDVGTGDQSRMTAGTNITELCFDDGAQINVVKRNPDGSDGYTYVCSKIDFSDEAGVGLEYEDDGVTYRAFVPWHVIDRIYQQV